ncbi:hypothetical protein DAEQUDRAFT_729826 [Daedalea quercina L-15889]|uniref:Uncharacterized protein n=1 Tax=Daedalea quercina L-15889 TaxID=1314783 RepID=A0A165NE71_9APHY|nr:hypothetical protein DAEQUDRAFT_729826 [Daedalea quercina L-15889]
MKIAIYSTYPYSHKDSAFSVPEDLGAVVGNANSRTVGTVTGGASQIDYIDVTYASPYYDERFKKAFPNSPPLPHPGLCPA